MKIEMMQPLTLGVFIPFGLYWCCLNKPARSLLASRVGIPIKNYKYSKIDVIFYLFFLLGF